MELIDVRIMVYVQLSMDISEPFLNHGMCMEKVLRNCSTTGRHMFDI